MKHFLTNSALFLMLPFFSFILGYFIISFYYKADELNAPSLIGLQVPDALRILSNLQLYPHLLAEKEDADLPDGTIISQFPKPQTTIKPQSSMLLVLSKKPGAFLAPLCYKKTITEIEQLITPTIIMRTFNLSSTYPEKTCFAQSPAPGTPLNAIPLIIYSSSGNSKPVIFPDFTNHLITEVIEFLTPYPVTIEILHAYPIAQNHQCTTCRIVNQRPLSGSIITLSPEKKLHIQLQVQ